MQRAWLTIVVYPPPPPLAAVLDFDSSSRVSGPPDDYGSFYIVAGGTGCNDYDDDLRGVESAPSNGWSSCSDVQV